MSVDTASSAAADFSAMRRAMVDSQLRTNDITEPALVAAMRSVAREDFVPEPARAASYIDRAVPLANGRAINPPLTTARLIVAADVRAGDSVLLVGGTTGYTAALLAHMGAKVTMVESDAALLGHARTALAGIDAVTLVEAALTDGCKQHAPYDRIIIEGAVEHVPATLAAQLGDGGVLAAGLVEGHVTHIAQAISAGQAALRLMPLDELECVILADFAAPKRFTF